MDKIESISMSLNLYKTMKFNAKVSMMNKKSFIAFVGDFDYKEEEDRVTFIRSGLTETFPNDEDGQPAQTYTTYIKNIKEVDWVREKRVVDKRGYLEDLIVKINGELDTEPVAQGSKKVSWKANREAETIEDEAFLSHLQELLRSEKIPGRRQAIYTLLGHLAKNTNKGDIIEIILEQLPSEKEENILHHMLTEVHWAELTFTKFIKELIIYTNDERDLIRNAAIRCLALDANKSEASEQALIDVLENAYDEYGLRYSADSLAKIGSSKALPYLQKVLQKLETPEAIQAVNHAIKAIEERSTGSN